MRFEIRPQSVGAAEGCENGTSDTPLSQPSAAPTGMGKCPRCLWQNTEPVGASLLAKAMDPPPKIQRLDWPLREQGGAPPRSVPREIPQSVGTNVLARRWACVAGNIVSRTSSLLQTSHHYGCHNVLPPSSLRSRKLAALISARWLRAWGVLPRWWPWLSNSSAYNPSGLA